ncbi:MAG: translocation/assembly module TamB domain-containing protein [Aquincola sp.]|nr:translocation/assembly module TamB domain-containing protein [Aquincola sp.]
MNGPPAPIARPRRPLGGSLRILAVALLVVMLVLAAALSALLHTERGSAWLLERVPGFTVVAPHGRLFGGAFSAERIEVKAGVRPLVVHGLSWRDAQWRWHPYEGAWIGLAVTDVLAERVEVGASASTAGPVEPASLRLPFALTLAPLRVAQLHVEAMSVVRDLTVQVELGHAQGQEHRLQALSFRSDRASVTGDMRVAADAPFSVAARLQARSADGAPARWDAQAKAEGPLANFALDLRLTSPDAGGAALQARAGVAPFAAWPLATLQASMQDLDLAAVWHGAPQTRISGQARIETNGLDRPVQVRASLTNGLSGRWDAKRLPVAAVDIELAGRADERTRLAADRFDIRLAADAGRISGSGQWFGDTAKIDLSLHGVRPALLDTRAPAMSLSGTLATQWSGLPALDGSRPAATEQQMQARMALEGRLDAQRGAPVALRGAWSAERTPARTRIELRDADASAGGASLKGNARLERAAGAAWQFATQGEASDFDPALWWPGVAAARLNGRWQAELTGPPGWWVDKGAPTGWLALRGAAQVDLQDSVLAGVALAGRARLDGRAPGWSVDGEVRAANNRLTLQGRVAPRAQDDRWRASLDAPALASLRPWRALSRSLAAWFDGLDGALAGDAQATGRWPALASSGTVRASAVRAGVVAVRRLDAKWQAGPDRDAPLALDIDGEQIAQGAQSIDAIKVRLDGSLAAHRITLDAASALRPPAWTDALLGLRGTAGAGSRVQLRGEGRWQRATGTSKSGGSTWRARVSALDARSPQAPQAWLAVRDAELRLAFDADDRLVEAVAEPGRAQVLGAPLVWREARWQAAEGARAALIVVDADLSPTPVVPWLQRWQPNAGFGGDLAIQGRIVVRQAEKFAADIVLERAGGDLKITEEGDTQALGLTDLRLALAAQDGTWHFTQAMAGANVGVLAGAQSMRLVPQATWPAPDTPMQGVLEWRVPDIGVWARFTPPGWRVAGQLRTSAAIGGRFGAPEVEGRMEGSGLAIRNLLQGVDLREGELALSLRGADARVEQFVFKGGDGELRLTGGASLGAEPTARLRLAADRFRLLGRIDRRIVLSGQTELVLSARALSLDGKLSIDEGLIDVSRGDAPTLDADVQVHGGRHRSPDPAPDPAAPDKGEPAAPPRLRDVRVALEVDLGPQLRLRGRGLDTRLTGRLAITAPGGRVALNGQVSARDGTYAAYGQKLEIERGVLAFTGEAENPRLDIFAVRPNLDVKVGVLVGGTAQNPRVRLMSEPDMSEYYKLSWLVLGRAPDGLARADTALLQRAALALLSGTGQGPDAAMIANLGLDELSVRQTESGEVRDTVVTLGKQLSRRWYVGYERGVNSTSGTWQMVYRVAQRFTLRAQSGLDNSLDAIWTWRWN